MELLISCCSNSISYVTKVEDCKFDEKPVVELASVLLESPGQMTGPATIFLIVEELIL